MRFEVAGFRSALEQWFAESGRDLPWRRTTDPYAVLVSEFMCQQTTVAAVVPYFERWMARWPSVADLAAASEDEVLSVWEGLGYYSRGRNLRRAAIELRDRFGGKVPADYESLRSLPGVGEYTANAVLAFAFDLAAPVVDGNVARVLTRIFDYREPIDSGPGKIWLRSTADELQETDAGRAFNSAVMELGALVCRPRSPLCLSCPVRTWCRTSEAETLPVKRPRAKITKLTERREWIFDGEAVWLTRSEGARWRGMWVLPGVVESPKSQCRDGSAGADVLWVEEYPITRYRVRLEVVAGLAREGLTRFSLDALAVLAVPAPHRRVIRAMLAES